MCTSLLQKFNIKIFVSKCKGVDFAIEVTMSHVPKPVFSHGNVFLVKSVNVLVLLKFDI